MTASLFINLGLSVNGDDHSILITNRVLRWLVTSPPYVATNITYTLTTAPISGKLQIKTQNIWIDLAATETFTQDDIDNNRIRYVPDTTTPATTSFTLTASDGTSTTPVSTVSITVQTKAPVTTPARDNVIDLSTQTTPKKIETEAGKDTIKPGPGNDRIKPGRDDDKIDLSTGGADEVYYEYQKTDSGYIALDGGDDITSFKRGEDKLVFGSAKDDDFIKFVNEKYKVMVEITQNAANIWQVTGLNFIFADAVFTSNGALASGVLSLTFATPIELDDFQALVDDGEPTDGFNNQTGLITTPKALIAVLGHDSIGTETTGTTLADVTVDIHENHPLTKAVFDFDPPDNETGGTFSLEEGVQDNDLFTIDSDGKLWWRDLVDYETSRAKFGGNIYRVKVKYTAQDDSVTTTRMDITVQDLTYERNTHERSTGVELFSFNPTYVPDAEEPTGLERHLISGVAWSIPISGPLILTWSIEDYLGDRENPPPFLHETVTPYELNRLTSQDLIKQARNKIETALAEFEAAINVKFIEVDNDHLEKDIRGDIQFMFFNHQSTRTGSWDSAKTKISLRRNKNYDNPVDLDDVAHTTIVKQIGLALGLSHPYESRGGWPGNAQYRETSESVMSNYLHRAGLQEADIKALQFIYGQPGTNYQSVERFLEAPRQLDGAFYSARQTSTTPENTNTDTIIHNVYNSFLSHSRRYTVVDPVTYNLDDSKRDNKFFKINSANGLIKLKQQLDYENPLDGELGDARFARNNTYELEVVLRITLDLPENAAAIWSREPGVNTLEARQYIAITITDINEPLPLDPPSVSPDII